MTTQALVLERPREEDGWRVGRPVEDPEKLKRWGFVTAKPSEYLVHVRRGAVTSRSGQGASCFKWPWDAVAIVPTSLQRLQFRADQVTAEKVGVEVVGLAVYRIADPLLAFRVLNFSYPERAQEKLEHTLTAMFVGATRRIVATLGVEDCLRKRKAALAQELLREIAPVIGGEGRPEDATDQGWGVVLDTLEIQEVRVLSENVFAAMQAPYRARLEREASEARAETDQAIAMREAERRRATELAQLEVESELAQQRTMAERQALDQAAETAMRRAALEAAQAQRALEDEREHERQRIAVAFDLDRERARVEEEKAASVAERALAALEREAERARASLAAHEVLHAAEERRGELERLVRLLEQEHQLAGVKLERECGMAKAEVAFRQGEVQMLEARAEAELERARRLPELAQALGTRMGEMRITQLGGADAHPLGPIVQSIEALLSLVRSRSE